MKKLTILFTIFLFCLSCNKKSKEEQNLLFDFGKGKYEEPFTGLLKSKPGFLVKSLQYPPFKWFDSDTLVLNKSFIIDFNEEAIRSESTATIAFVDSLYQPFNGLKFYCNGIPFEKGKYIIHADSISKTLNIKCKVLPQFGQNLAKGHLIIQGHELDIVNSLALQEDYNVVADWQSEQKLSWPIMLWLSWILVGLLAVAVVAFILYWVFVGLSWVAKSVSTVFSTIFAKRSNRSKKLARNNEKKTETESSDEEKHKRPSLIDRYHIFMLKLYNRKYKVSNPVRKRGPALVKLLYHYKRLRPRYYYAITHSKLSHNTINDINKLRRKERRPKSNGQWSGKKGNSYWIFNDDYVPKEPKGNILTWIEIRKAYEEELDIKIPKGIKYKNNQIDLRSIAVAKVKVKYENSNFGRGGGNGVQDHAIKPFTKKLKRKIKKGGYKDFWEYKNGFKYGEKFREKTVLVPHEDYDCETIYLVPKTIHDNLSHYGGISVCEVIRGIKTYN